VKNLKKGCDTDGFLCFVSIISADAVDNQDKSGNQRDLPSSVDLTAYFPYDLSGTQTPTAQQYVIADVDGDGFVTSSDAHYILRYATNLIDHFPLYD